LGGRSFASGENEENPARAKELKEPVQEAELAGQKRLRCEAFNAVKPGEIVNSVEVAFMKRPCSPKNYRIFSDK